ncbi:hypothetical protein MYCO108962_22525 [Mycobacterium colombiense]
MSAVQPDPFAPATLGPVTLRNRVIKAATSEGRSPHGLVTDDLIEFHRAFSSGGVGMTTVAYCCVSAEGASAPGQIVMSEAALPGLRGWPTRSTGTAPRSRRNWVTPVSWRTRS